MKKVVGFDLDDTLIAEALFLRSGIRHIASMLHAEHPMLPMQRVIGCMDCAVWRHANHYSALERLIAEYGLSAAIDMSEVVDRFRSHFPDPSVYHLPPSKALILEDLRRDPDVSTVLITDGRSLTQRNKIKAAGIDTFFDDEDIYISEERGHDKTHPDTFLQIMRKYDGVKEFHYIADNPPKDFLQPSMLGWQTHQVSRFPLMIHQGMPK